MNRLLIEKRNGCYFVQYNENSFECQHLADALAPVVGTEYQNEMGEYVEGLFENWGVMKLTLEGESQWCAVAELATEYVAVEESHPIAALLALMSPLILCKVAQRCPQLAQ